VIFLSGSYIFTRVFNALTSREGKRVTLPTLVSMTGLTEAQIQGSIANARRTSEAHRRQIEVVRVGRVWRFKAVNGVGEYPTAEDIVKEVEMGSKHIWKSVLAALVSNAGNVTSKELLAELVSTDERQVTPVQAAHAMLTVMRQPNISGKIETLWKGNAWKYRADPEAAAKSSKTTPEEHKPVSAPIRGSVLRYFAQRPGVTLFRDDIAQDLGFTVKQVQSAIWGLLNENPSTKDDFVVIQSSYAWQYVPNRKAKAQQQPAPEVTPAPEVKPQENGRVTPALTGAPAQAYTHQVATAHLPGVPSIPQVQPEPAPAAVVTKSGRLFEEIGQTTEGAVLVKESESGTIYRATPLA
jgi:hypothetical protein